MKRMALKACQNGLRRLLAGVVALMLMPGDGVLVAQPQDPQGQDSVSGGGSEASADQLDSLVAPIALYPDPLLSQVLVASTYPLEIIELSSGWTRTRA